MSADAALQTESRASAVALVAAALPGFETLLESAIALQSRVIETIAGAALPRANVPGYGARGQFRAPKQAPALALSARV